jgi:hypothetical protein
MFIYICKEKSWGARDVGYAVKCMSTMCKALTLIPSTEETDRQAHRKTEKEGIKGCLQEQS